MEALAREVDPLRAEEGHVYMGELFDLLGECEADRERYPTFPSPVSEVRLDRATLGTAGPRVQIQCPAPREDHSRPCPIDAPPVGTVRPGTGGRRLGVVAALEPSPGLMAMLAVPSVVGLALFAAAI